jgi:hypothetical protein
MQVNAQARDDVLQTAREYGAALGEHIIAVFGEQIPNEKVDEAVAFVTAEIFRRIEEMSSQNVAAVIVLDWGHECINALQERILEHTGYLLMAAALVGFDPWPAVLRSSRSARKATRRGE